MLTSKDRLCTQCGSLDTVITMQVDRIVRFKVECNRCGCFSHNLKHGEIQRLVKRYLDHGRVIADVASEEGK